MKRFLLILPPLLLAACAKPPAETPPPVLSPAALCRSDEFRGMIGKPRTALRDMALPKGSRIIGPNDAVTMDYRQDRLNFEIDQNGRIAKIGCY